MVELKYWEVDRVEEKEKGPVIIALSQEDLLDLLEKAANAGARAGIDKYVEEVKASQKKRTDRRLHNTKLLLRNYRMLKAHAESSVFGRTQMEESASDILESMMSMYDSEVIVDSIRRSATRTAIIIGHIEAMFSLYEAYCEKAANPEIERRRYEAVRDMYIAEMPLTIEEIAEKQFISVRSAYSNLNAGTERLSALLFGVDGLI